MKETVIDKEAVLASAKAIADRYLAAADFSGRSYDKGVVLSELSRRTHGGKPVRVRVVDSHVEVLSAAVALLVESGTSEDDARSELQTIKIAECVWDYYLMAFWDAAYSQCPDQSHEFGRQSFFTAFAAGLGYYVNLGSVAVGVMRPVAYRDPERRIHREDGPAIIWGDDQQYWWHGTRIPGHWLTRDPKLASEILQEKNVEKRRAGCEVIGWDAIIKELGARVIAEDAYGQLLEADLPDAYGSRFVRVRCATGRDFVIPTTSEVKSAREAVALSYGITRAEDYDPEVRS